MINNLDCIIKPINEAFNSLIKHTRDEITNNTVNKLHKETLANLLTLGITYINKNKELFKPMEAIFVRPREYYEQQSSVGDFVHNVLWAFNNTIEQEIKSCYERGTDLNISFKDIIIEQVNRVERYC